LSKKLEELEAGQAGVSQAVLERAFKDLPSLEIEKDEVEAEFATALEAKKTAQAKYLEVKQQTHDKLRQRDAIFEEWQRAAWIVRNADPDYPTPPTGIRPPDIETPRGS
jgi:hypothetical protein